MLLETTGNATVGFEAEDIERDFDPDEYDEMMQVNGKDKHMTLVCLICRFSFSQHLMKISTVMLMNYMRSPCSVMNNGVIWSREMVGNVLVSVCNAAVEHYVYNR